MEIINIDKLQGHKRIVLTGRYKSVIQVAEELVDDYFVNFWTIPHSLDYFEDYPLRVNNTFDRFPAGADKIGIIYTNSLEFLDVMLKSKHDFILGTVRQDPKGQLRIRVLTKEEALYNRETFNMELRV